MKFHEGQKLKAVYWSDCGTLKDDDITVVMENGQMALTPWALVKSGQRVTKINLALAEMVELFDETEGDEK